MKKVNNKRGALKTKRTAIEHHVNPLRYSKKNNEIIVVCDKCHSLIHNIISREAIIEAYKSNPNYFRDCLELAIIEVNNV